MFRVISRFVRSSVSRRRMFAGLFAAFFLAVQAFSSLFVIAEADHDCHGSDCPVCQEIQSCIDSFQSTGPAPVSADLQAEPVAAPCATTPVRSHRAPATTLQSLDVRFDE